MSKNKKFMAELIACKSNADILEFLDRWRGYTVRIPKDAGGADRDTLILEYARRGMQPKEISELLSSKGYRASLPTVYRVLNKKRLHVGFVALDND